jgi:hypothetical protein
MFAEEEGATMKKAMFFQNLTIGLFSISFIFNLIRMVCFIIFSSTPYLHVEKTLSSIGRIFNIIGSFPEIISTIISILTLIYFHEIKYRSLREFVLVAVSEKFKKLKKRQCHF